VLTAPRTGYKSRGRVLDWLLFCQLFCDILYTAYILLFRSYSDIVVRFSDPDFPKESNNLAIIRRFHTVTLTFDIWPWTFVEHTISDFVWSNQDCLTLTFNSLTLNVCCRLDVSHVIKLCTRLEPNRTIRDWVIEHLVNFRILTSPL